MTDHYPPTQQYQSGGPVRRPGDPIYTTGLMPSSPPKKRRTWLHFVGYPVVFLAAFGIGAAGGGTDATSSTPGPTVTVTQPAPDAKPAATTSAPEPTFARPTKANFKLTVKLLTKKCFGEAGCNLTYRILVKYTGPRLEPGKEYEVLYEVRGGEDGPVANKLTVHDNESSVEESESIGTSSSRVKLSAVVTDVL